MTMTLFELIAGAGLFIGVTALIVYLSPHERHRRANRRLGHK